MSDDGNASTQTTSPEVLAGKAKRTPRWPLFAILAVTVAAYIPALSSGFIWDDDDHFVTKENMNDAAGLRRIWTTSDAVYYPLTLTTWWVLRQSFGLAPLPFHLLTILIHALNAWILWRVLRRLGVPGAMLAGFLFALHPIHAESVAWATELKNTQSGFFFLLSVGCFVRLVECIDAGIRRPWKWYILSLVLFLAAILSKPSAVMLPLGLLLLLWWRQGSWNRRHIALVGPFMLAAALMSGWTIWEQQFHSGAIGDEWSESWAQRIAIAGRIPWFYVGKLLWPSPLIFIYPRWTIDASQILAYLPLVLLLATMAVLLRSRAAWSRPALFAVGCYLVLLFPVLGIFRIYYTRYSYVADHFAYLPSLGLIAGFAAAVAVAARRFSPVYSRGAAVALLAILATLTFRHAKAFRDPMTVWGDTINKNRNAYIAQFNLANELVAQARFDEAIFRYQETLRTQPSSARAHTNLAHLLSRRGLLDDALEHYRDAVKLQPRSSADHYNLANALFHVGLVDEAITHYREAVRLEPDAGEAHLHLGVALARQGDEPAAQACYAEALRRQPGLDQLYNSQGLREYAVGNFSGALDFYRWALLLRPQTPELLINQGAALRKVGDAKSAEASFREALRLSPDDSAAHFQLGRILFETKRLEEGLGHIQEALRIEPTNDEAYFFNGLILEELGRIDEAIAAYRDVLWIVPDQPDAALRLEAALARQREGEAENPRKAEDAATSRAAEGIESREN